MPRRRAREICAALEDHARHQDRWVRMKDKGSAPILCTFELESGGWVYAECCLEDSETRLVVVALQLF